MGVKVIEADSASDSYDEYDECTTCKSQHKTKTTNGKRTTTTTETINGSYASRDLVGNCKEYRIENNSRDLRIIGNGNKVRIVNNTGSLLIIGNSTRLKIQQNSGYIKYTGNDGRIYLGSKSQQQNVDYIGCNGLLKVVKSLQLESTKSSKSTKTQEQPAKTPQSNKSQSPVLEIENNLTIVNGVAGNIVIKNAINVSI